MPKVLSRVTADELRRLPTRGAKRRRVGWGVPTRPEQRGGSQKEG